jgi:hypothetical protein
VPPALQLKAAHPRHIDVRQDQDERTIARIGDALECGGGGLGKLYGEPASAKVAPELLAKQHFDIRLIIDHEMPPTIIVDGWRKAGLPEK